MNVDLLQYLCLVHAFQLNKQTISKFNIIPDNITPHTCKDNISTPHTCTDNTSTSHTCTRYYNGIIHRYKNDHDALYDSFTTAQSIKEKYDILNPQI